MSALVAYLDLNSDAFKKKLAEALVAAKTMAGQTGSAVQDVDRKTAAWRNVLREVTVIIREIARGNWSRVASSLTLLVQYLNDAVKLMKIFSVVGLGMIGLATAVFGAFALSINHVANRMIEFNAAFNETHGILEKIAKSMETVSRNAYEFSRWLGNLGQSDNNLNAMAEDRLRSDAERFAARQRIAQLRGQSPTQAARAEISEQNAELQTMGAFTSRARARRDTDVQAARSAASTSAQFETEYGRHIDALQETMRQGSTLYDKLLTKFRDDNPVMIALRSGFWDALSGQPAGTDLINQLDELETSNAEFGLQARELRSLSLQRQRYQDNQRDAEQRADRSQRAYDDLARQQAQRQNAFDIATNPDYGLMAAAVLQEQNQHGIFRGATNSLQRVGAYTPAAQVEILDVNRRMERHLARIEHNTARSGGANQHIGSARF